MRSVLTILFLSLFAVKTFSQEYYSIRSRAMASATLADDFHSNASTLSLNSTNTVSLSAENRFLENELTSYILATEIHGDELDFAAQLYYFGYAEYHDISGRLILAKSLSPRVSAGMGVRYNSHKHIGADNMAYLGIAPGVLFRLPLNQEIGVSASADFLMTDNDGENRILGNISYGITLDRHLFTLECAYTEYKYILGKAGYEAKITEQFLIRCGLTYPIHPTPSFGIGLKLGITNIDLSYAFHQHLRGMFGAGIAFNLPNKSSDK